MKTAVEWLEEEYIKRSNNMVKMSVLSAFSEAKEMEKQQIIDAYIEASPRLEDITKEAAENYYKETFKTDKG
jgi:hypothetical protein